MKITLNASIKEHREIAELFRNQPCEFKRSISSKSMGGAFVSVMDSPHYPKFVVYRLGDVTTKESVTIDLDQVKMDLRMALGTSIEFSLKQNTMLYIGQAKSCFLNMYKNLWLDFGEGTHNADSVVLCPDYLKSVGVEVED